MNTERSELELELDHLDAEKAVARAVDPVAQEMKNYEIVQLTGGNYKKHKRIQAYLGSVIGTSCRKFQSNEINYDQFMRMQIEAVKKCVRTYGLSITLRAWRELLTRLQQIPNRTMEGFLVLFQPTSDTFTFNFGQPRILVDTLPDRFDPEAEAIKRNIIRDGDPDELLKFHTNGKLVDKEPV